MKPLVILLISVSLTSIGQIILKKGLLIVGPIEKMGLKFFQMLSNPLVMLGVTFAILGWTAYVMALSKAELSYAYPIWSLTYVIVPLLSLFIFKESISLMKMGGLGFIFLGVFLVATSINVK
ncbi:MAG: EamA family transporter [Candidatus Omnitrophota bacterium]|nr:MAG: EamA family transporter [Candidatus Omnitrophota bacterium]